MKAQEDPLHSFANLPPEIETELRKHLRVFSFSAGEYVFIQGASPKAVYLVANGRIKVVRGTPEGHETVLCMRSSGDYFCPVPLLDGGKHLGTAVAVTDVTLFSIEREIFTDLCAQSPELLATVQGDCLSEVRNLLNRLEIFAFRNVRERLAIALLNQAGQQNKNGRATELRLTQQDLADLIGASRESVSRVLKEFERNQFVTLGRGRIILKDKKRLQRLVD
ncbi:MAG: cyclic nucleotide-binding domain-containing protein [Aquificales bacterium]|nr:cyclic nucleotide-binding domain-containing protein [Aquificales bacterium]